MIDFRDYKDAIKTAVRNVSLDDPNWNWRVKSIGKKKATFDWGYTTELGEGPFVLSQFAAEELFDEDSVVSEQMIIAEDPHGNKVYVLVGEKHWDDYEKIEDGIRGAIRGIAYSAHRSW